MNLYLICFRLNIALFALSNLGAVYLYRGTHSLVLAVEIKLIIFPLIFMALNPFVKRYNYLFLNKGWSILKLYAVTASIDLMIFFIFILYLNLK